MKGTTIKMVCILVLVILLATLAGCGKKNNQAEGFLDKAEGYLTETDRAINDVSTEFDSLVKNIKEGTSLTVELVEQTYNTVKSQAEKIVDQVKSAQDENRKILEMKGVEGYKRYVDIQNQVLDNAVEMTKILGELFDQLSGVATAIKSGKAPDTSHLAKTAESWRKQFDELVKKGKALEEKAGKIKKEEGL